MIIKIYIIIYNMYQTLKILKQEYYINMQVIYILRNLLNKFFIDFLIK